jgi:signal transduction histidine kinase
MKHTILCVDDEVDNVDALERLFRKRYTVLKATSGSQALEMLKEHRPSLIISDQRMPGMTGVEFLSKSMKAHPDTMRILLTGYTDIESVIDSINSGQVYRYVTKPWDPVDFSNTVDKAIERFELSSELKEKNQALKKALDELKTLDAAKSEFMILINHELKTPLTVILSYIELLRESGLDSDLQKYLDRISTSADRLQSLISDSLELVSAETGTLKIKMSKTSTSDIIGDLESAFAQPANTRHLNFTLDDAQIKFRADSQILKNVMRRLTDNAVKFAKDKTEILVSAREESGGVLFEIANHGKSLSKDKIEKILQPFRLDEDMLHHSKGTGLGLSVCQALLHRHGSELQIECPSGKFIASFLIRDSDA